MSYGIETISWRPPCRFKMAAKLNPRNILCLFVAFTVVVIVANAARLSHPKILLPYHSSVITNFTLNINLSREESRLLDTCYTWWVGFVWDRDQKLTSLFLLVILLQYQNEVYFKALKMLFQRLYSFSCSFSGNQRSKK